MTQESLDTPRHLETMEAQEVHFQAGLGRGLRRPKGALFPGKQMSAPGWKEEARGFKAGIGSQVDGEIISSQMISSRGAFLEEIEFQI